MAPAKDFWFRPKSHGYGAEPSNWKGWAVTLGFVAAMLALTYAYVLQPVMQGGEPNSDDLVLWAVLLAVGLTGFVWFCWLKTDGDWRWRWGKRD